MRLECTKRAQKAYRAKGKQFHFLITERDNDIREWINQQESATGSIKALIRADIAKQEKKL